MQKAVGSIYPASRDSSNLRVETHQVSYFLDLVDNTTRAAIR